MSRPNKTCRECGRIYQPDGALFGCKEEGFCSEGCREKAKQRRREKEQREREEQERRREEQRKERLRLLKEAGTKKVAKWEKEIKKRRDWIENLNTAIRGDNPDTIVIAINGGVFERLWHTIKTMVFTIGVAAILVFAVYAYMKISGIHGEGHSVDCAEKTAEIVNEQPPLVDPGVVDRTLDVTLTKETTTAEAQTESKATSAEVAAPTIEIDATPINK